MPLTWPRLNPRDNPIGLVGFVLSMTCALGFIVVFIRAFFRVTDFESPEWLTLLALVGSPWGLILCLTSLAVERRPILALTGLVVLVVGGNFLLLFSLIWAPVFAFGKSLILGFAFLASTLVSLGLLGFRLAKLLRRRALTHQL